MQEENKGANRGGGTGMTERELIPFRTRFSATLVWLML